MSPPVIRTLILYPVTFTHDDILREISEHDRDQPNENEGYFTAPQPQARHLLASDLLVSTPKPGFEPVLHFRGRKIEPVDQASRENGEIASTQDFSTRRNHPRKDLALLGRQLAVPGIERPWRDCSTDGSQRLLDLT